MILNNQKLSKLINHFLEKQSFLLALGMFIFLNLIFTYYYVSEAQDIDINNLSEGAPKTITIASETDYPPYCILDDEGNPDGFSVELFKETAAAVGLNVNIKIGIWAQMRQDLFEGRLDALPLMTHTAEREDLYDFSMPYHSLHGGIFVRNSTTDIQSVADLEDKTIVVMRGSSAEEYAKKENLSTNIFTVNNHIEAFKDLANGIYDVVLTQRITGIHLLEELRLNSIHLLSLQLPGYKHDYCFAVQKGNTELLNLLNEGLSIVIANGTYEKIRLNWLGPQIIEEIPLGKIITIALQVFIPLFILFLLVSIFILRRQVSKRTSSLQEEVEEHKNTLDILRKQQLLLKDMEKVPKIGGWEYDVETGKVNCTNGVYEIYGVSLEENTLSSYEVDSLFYLPEAKNKLDKAFEKALKTGEPYDLVLEFKSADGVKKWVRTCGQAEKEHGKVTRLYGNIMDVTEQVQTEFELRKLKEELETQVAERTAQLQKHVSKLDKSQKALLYMVEDLNEITGELKSERKKLKESNQELEAFTYSVSHDLRAPLRAINGFSSFLLEDYSTQLDDEGRRYLNTIRNNAAKMDQLITDLLNLSRIYRTEFKLEGVKMDELVKSIYHEVATGKEKEEFDVIINDMGMVKCDSNLMKHVWQNLIENALKYSSKSEKKKIIIDSRKENNEIVFFIQDMGVGFNPKYIKKLFGVFQRLHREEEFEGTGVGLAIVKRVISRHGGRVWAEGEEGKGATFYFTLPGMDFFNAQS